MEKLKVLWYKNALKRHRQNALWYENLLGMKAARAYVNDVEDTVKVISRFPGIGVLDERRSTTKLKYYSFLSHPYYRIVYRYTETTLYIVAIRATRMK